MRVGDLLKQLDGLDPNMELLGYSEDEALNTSGHFFRLFEVQDVSTGPGVLVRGSDGITSMRFEQSERSQECAFLHMSMTF